MIPIFLSRPNPFTNRQADFLSHLSQFLSIQSMEGITLKAKDYNPYESLSCINGMIKRCYGIIIVAFGQSYIDNGSSKKGAIHNVNFFNSEEKNINSQWITSPFCHIEGAIAFSNGIPLLIIEQEHLKIEGVLKQGTHAIHCPPIILDNAETCTYFNNEDFLSSFTIWSEKVKKIYNFIHIDFN